jgi:hypothetical protein
MPVPITFLNIQTSEHETFANKLIDPRGGDPTSNRASMMDREAMMQAQAERDIDDILDAEFMGTTTTTSTIPVTPSEPLSSDHYHTELSLKGINLDHHHVDHYIDNSTVKRHAYSSSPSSLVPEMPPLPNISLSCDTDYPRPPITSDEQYDILRSERNMMMSTQNESHDDSYDIHLTRDDISEADNQNHHGDISEADNHHGHQDINQLKHNSKESMIALDTKNTDWGEDDVPKGFSFHKFFPNFGWFQGTVIEIRMGAKDNKTRRVSYCDGDVEDLSINEIRHAMFEYMKCCSDNTAKEGDSAYSRNAEKSLDASDSTNSTSATADKSKMKKREKESVVITKSIRKKPSRNTMTRVAKVPYSSSSTKSRKRDLFDEKIDMLREYKNIHGHVNVPTYDENKKLANWCLNVRKGYKQWKAGERNMCGINHERVKQLEALGFKWEIKAPLIKERFEEKIKALREFREKYGHVNVPTRPNRYPEDPSLVLWCKNIRAAYKRWVKGEKNSQGLTDERVKCLEELGFEWNLKGKRTNERFEGKFQDLLEFKKKHGHLEVSQKNMEDRPLYQWCGRLRRYYKEWTVNKAPLPGLYAGLTEEGIQRLKEIGFRFEIPARLTFEERIEELREFKRKYGHMRLTDTNKMKEYESLAKWCSSIRYAYPAWKHNLPNRKLRGLNEERVKVLEDMGFRFRLRN